MEIKLKVEGSQLDAEVKNLLANLTIEQKQEMAIQVLTNVLSQTKSELNTSIAEQIALDVINTEKKQFFRQKSTWGDMVLFYRNKDAKGEWVGHNNATYEEKEKFNYKFREATSLSTYFKSTIVDQMVATAKNRVKELVESHDEINKAIEVAKKQIVEALPVMVQQAMVCYFSSQMQNVMSAVTNQYLKSQGDAELIGNIQKALSDNGICV